MQRYDDIPIRTCTTLFCSNPAYNDGERHKELCLMCILKNLEAKPKPTSVLDHFSQPYETNNLGDAQWLVSMLELYLLEHGHPQEKVNSWIVAHLLNSIEKDNNDE